MMMKPSQRRARSPNACGRWLALVSILHIAGAPCAPACAAPEASKWLHFSGSEALGGDRSSTPLEDSPAVCVCMCVCVYVCVCVVLHDRKPVLVMRPLTCLCVCLGVQGTRQEGITARGGSTHSSAHSCRLPGVQVACLSAVPFGRLRCCYASQKRSSVMTHSVWVAPGCDVERMTGRVQNTRG
jgi:hypothetical protein